MLRLFEFIGALFGTGEARATHSWITIETTRFSAVVHAFVKNYPTATAKLDKKVPAEDLSVWCTNDRLKSAINFSLIENGIEILGFHDGPKNMWAARETLSFVKVLAEEKILRFRE